MEKQETREVVKGTHPDQGAFKSSKTMLDKEDRTLLSQIEFAVDCRNSSSSIYKLIDGDHLLRTDIHRSKEVRIHQSSGCFESALVDEEETSGLFSVSPYLDSVPPSRLGEMTTFLQIAAGGHFSPSSLPRALGSEDVMISSNTNRNAVVATVSPDHRRSLNKSSQPYSKSLDLRDKQEDSRQSGLSGSSWLCSGYMQAEPE